MIVALGMCKHVQNKGYLSIDKCLDGSEHDFLPVNRKSTNVRTHIWIIALSRVCSRLKKVGDASLKVKLCEDILLALESLTVENISHKTSAKCCKSLAELTETHYGSDTKSFIDDLYLLFSRNVGNMACLSKDDFAYFLKKFKNKRYYVECLTTAYREKHELKTLELVYLQSNFSGTALFNELRKILPGIFPSRRAELSAKKAFDRSFRAVLLPKRISTGWYVDPVRLLEVLLHKYPFLPSEGLQMKVFGDGRDYGGRHSVFVAMSFLNNELYLNNLSYQSPKEMFEIALFYESDSRDNLEENLLNPNFIDNFISKCDGNKAPLIDFYLTGDDMFNIAMLDGQGMLGPLTQTGWNLYSATDTTQKDLVGPSGLRTDLVMPFDRDCPEAILPSIKVAHVRFCLLHCLARCVEKLLFLVASSASNEKDKLQTAAAQTLAGEDLIRNLEININKRGVRQGKFAFLFDKSGKLEPIKLNKDHALLIISPQSQETQHLLPHVLHNVLGKEHQESLPIPKDIQNKLGLPETMSVFDSVSLIWDSMYNMFNILRCEPEPVLKANAPEGSTLANDYTWGYSDEIRAQFKKHAEIYYQLFKWQYGANHLTPYMMKLLDYAPLFMENSEIPLCRFQAEGAEHLNYEHSTFYYSHTNRHGGAQRLDPLLAIFRNRWISIMHAISKGGRDVSQSFSEYIDRHLAAVCIQKHFRAFSARRRVQAYKKHSVDAAEAIHAVSVTSQNDKVNDESVVQEDCLFKGLNFFIAGTVAKNGKVRMTQDSLTAMLKKYGGRVTKRLPGKTKGKSTKKYVILFERAGPKTKIPNAVKLAIAKGYHIVSFKFVYKSIESGTLQSLSNFSTDLQSVKLKINKDVSLQTLHFSRQRSFLSSIKYRYRKKCITGKKKSLPNHIPNAASFYAFSKRKEHVKHETLPFHEYGRLFSKYLKLWKALPADSEEKKGYVDLWKSHCTSIEAKRQQVLKLTKYNTVQNPLYQYKFFSA